MKLSTLHDTTGISMIEVLVALIIFSITILGLTSAGIVAGGQLNMGRADIQLWTAVHYQMDQLTAEGYDSVTAGSATVQGYPMTWTIQGTTPKKILLVVDAKDSRGQVKPDTIVTYIADWTP